MPIQGGSLIGSAEGMSDWPIRREAEQIAADRKWAEELTAIERGQAIRGSDGNYVKVGSKLQIHVPGAVTTDPNQTKVTGYFAGTPS